MLCSYICNKVWHGMYASLIIFETWYQKKTKFATRFRYMTIHIEKQYIIVHYVSTYYYIHFYVTPSNENIEKPIESNIKINCWERNEIFMFYSSYIFSNIHGAFFQRRSAANKTKKKNSKEIYLLDTIFCILCRYIDSTKSGCVLRWYMTMFKMIVCIWYVVHDKK